MQLQALTKNQDSRLANIEVKNKDHETKIDKLETSMLNLIKASISNHFVAEATTREKRPEAISPSKLQFRFSHFQ